MGEFADRNGGNLREVIRAERLDFIEAANRYISEGAVRVTNDIDVVGNRARIDRFQDGERRTRIEHHDLTDILEREPDLLAIRACSDIRTERALLLHPSRDLVIGNGDDDSFRRE